MSADIKTIDEYDEYDHEKMDRIASEIVEKFNSRNNPVKIKDEEYYSKKLREGIDLLGEPGKLLHIPETSQENTNGI